MVDLSHFDMRAVLSEQPRDPGTNTGATARDDCDASREQAIPVVDGRNTVATAHGEGH
jgi:hypothetical protein